MLKRGCSVGFFGLGASSLSLLSNLPLDRCRITLRSDREISDRDIPEGIRIDRILCGWAAASDIDEDIIFFSPSVRRERPELVRARARGVIFSSDAELFFENNRSPVFAVTGSDGKSTTATLVNLLLREGGYKSELIGNIGRPMIESRGADVYVTELSSFMLTYLKPQVTCAAITGITPNHLDWHGSMDEYVETKLSLLCGAKRTVLDDSHRSADCLISERLSYEELSRGRSSAVYFTAEGGYILRNKKRLIDLSGTKMKGGYMLKNLMMAIAMTDGYVGAEEIAKVARDFQGLPHRCELVFRHNGIDFFDSSVDSTPARTAATLNSLDRRVVIILGGRGKELDYRDLIPALKKYAEHVVITGENAEEICLALGGELPLIRKESFEEAVICGKELAEGVGALLLSPASTSFDRFKNYAERGDRFRQILAEIIDNENNSLQNIEEMRKNSEKDLS